MMTMNIFIYESYPEEGIWPCPVIVEVFHHQLVVVQRPKLTARLTIIIITVILVMMFMLDVHEYNFIFLYIHIFEAFLFAELNVVRLI